MPPKLAVDIHAYQGDISQSAINFSASGNTTIVAGQSGLIIRVYKIFFIVSTSTNVTYQDGPSTAMSGPLNFSANEGMVLDFDTKPWFTCSIGNDFVLNQSGTAQVSGTAYYTQENA